MAQPIAPDYGQQFLLPPALEDWVPKDHPARFLREFVDQLELSKMGFVIPDGSEGRPPYATSLLLKIWLYGYFHRIRSCRKLEVATQENLPLVWLTGMIRPDHNTLWRFWRDNKKAIRQLFKQTVELAHRTGAIGLVLQALDGTKIQACASSHTGWSKDYMEKVLAQLDESIDQTDLKLEEEKAKDQGPYRLPASLTQRQELRQEIRAAMAQLAQDGRKHYHPVEPQARRMRMGGGDTNRYAYNAQAMVDSKEGVVVACDVSNAENDSGQLVPMIQQAAENVGVAQSQETLTLADTGYGAGSDLAAAAQAGKTVLVHPPEGKPAKKNPYASQHFKYDEETHSVTCPQGQVLKFEGQTHKRGMLVNRFRCQCKDCPVRAQCTKDRKGRQIEVWPFAPEVRQMREKLTIPANQKTLSLRGSIVERPFGQTKEHDGFRRWTLWTLPGAQAQWEMICSTLNLRVLYKHWRTRLGPKEVAAVAVATKVKEQSAVAMKAIGQSAKVITAEMESKITHLAHLVLLTLRIPIGRRR
jgi:transposase